MKFLVNLCISPKVVDELRKLNYTAMRVNEIGMAASKDKEIFQKAIENDMVLITADMDFNQILAFAKTNKPTTFIFLLKDMSPENILKYLLYIISKKVKEIDEGSIMIIKDGRIKIKRLPIGLEKV